MIVVDVIKVAVLEKNGQELDVPEELNLNQFINNVSAYQMHFQFIGKMNYNQYLISGHHVVKNNNYRRSGDPSNGARYGNSAPTMAAVTGEIYNVAAAIRGVAVSTASPAAQVNVNFELWNVGMSGNEGTKIGDVIVPVNSSQNTIGPYWNSSVVTSFQGGNGIDPVINVDQGKLLGLKFISVTGNSDAVSIENTTILLSLRQATS